MTNLHQLIMSAVENHTKANNVSPDPKTNQYTTHTRPRTLFRLSSNYATTMSPALCAQLDRYCAEERKTRSKAIRNAVYAVLENPDKLQNRPSNLPLIGQAPERNVVISWTMPSNKPQDLEHLHNMCPNRGGQSILVRRAIYLLTSNHRSTDADEHKEAMRDAWM